MYWYWLPGNGRVECLHKYMCIHICTCMELKTWVKGREEGGWERVEGKKGQGREGGGRYMVGRGWEEGGI